MVQVLMPGEKLKELDILHILPTSTSHSYSDIIHLNWKSARYFTETIVFLPKFEVSTVRVCDSAQNNRNPGGCFFIFFFPLTQARKVKKAILPHPHRQNLHHRSLRDHHQ